MLYAEKAEKFFEAKVCLSLLQKHANEDQSTLMKKRLMKIGLCKKETPQEDEARKNQAD